MRKQESVHLHALLVAVAEHLEARPEAASPEVSAYRDLDVSPASIHHSKDDHEEALLVLARCIADGLGQQATAGAGAR